MSEAFVIEGARVVLPGGVERVSVRVEAGIVTALDGPHDGAVVVDAAGLVLAPAMIDIHGDAFERQLMPRPGVLVPTDIALLETDRQLAANGIATAYHALTLSYEPGLRSVAMGAEVVDRLTALAPRLTVENRVQLRWETFCFDAFPLIERVLGGAPKPALAFNDHLSMSVLHPSVPLQDRPYEHDSAFPVTDFDAPGFVAKMEDRARRSGITTAEMVTLTRTLWERRAEVPARIADMAARARTAGAPMLSHDDSQPGTRDWYRAHGAGIAEFPMRVAVAQSARDAGDWVVFGAPNAARGGSHLGSPGAGAMVAHGLCDVLASDYYYPAMLAAVARLVAEGILPLHEAWRQVAAGPAAALGLADRGTIAPGLRADLVLVDWPEGEAPAVRRTWVAGRTAYAATGAAG